MAPWERAPGGLRSRSSEIAWFASHPVRARQAALEQPTAFAGGYGVFRAPSDFRGATARNTPYPPRAVVSGAAVSPFVSGGAVSPRTRLAQSHPPQHKPTP